MKTMNRDELIELLKTWSFPRGPFVSLDDVFADMNKHAEEMPPEDSIVLAQALVDLARDKDPLLQDLDEFLQIFATKHPEEVTKALSAHLAEDVSPPLVQSMGYGRLSSAAQELISSVDVDSADDDLLEAYACALGEIGGTTAESELKRMKSLNLSERVRKEVDIALGS